MWPFAASVAAVGVKLIFDVCVLFLRRLLLHPLDLLACRLVAALPRRRLALSRAVVRALALRAALHGSRLAAVKKKTDSMRQWPLWRFRVLARQRV